MGQIQLQGIIGPSGKHPSRFTLVAKNNLGSLNLISPLRDPTKFYKMLTDILSQLEMPNQKTKARKHLTEVEMVAKLVKTL